MRSSPLHLLAIVAGFFFFLPDVRSQDFYGSNVQEVRIELPYKNYDVKLDSLKTANPEARLTGTIWINGVRFDSVGVRYKGNSSYFRTRKETLRKLPINVKLDYKIKSQKLPGGHTTVKLSNAFLDPSFIRDPLAYEMIRPYMAAPQCNFTKLYINKKYYGLYVNTESIDQNFVQKHFGTTAGYLVKCDPDDWKRTSAQTGCPKGENASLIYLNDSPGCYDLFYEVDDPAAWKPLLHLIKTLNRKPADIEKVLDVDQALWMLALNNAIVNLDSYNGSLAHNYYLWFDTSGVAHPLIWDLNMAFGGWRRNFSFEDIPDEQLVQYSPLAEMENLRRPLISQLLKVPLYRKIYLAHLRTITNEWLKNGQWLTRAQAMSKQIDPLVRQDSLKLYSYEAFQNAYDKPMLSGRDNVIGLRQLMDKRSAWLLKHPLLTKPQPAIAEVRHSLDSAQWVVTAKLTGATGGWLCFRADKPAAFSRLAMYDAGADGDAVAGDGIFTARVPAAALKHYYIVAENAEAAATLPERASYEFFKVE